MITHHIPTAPPVSFFRVPPALEKYSNPTPVQKRTGEFTKPVDIATDASLGRLETLQDELLRDSAFSGTPLSQHLNHLISQYRANLETQRERDLFGLVEPHAREGGSGYLATCIIEDWLCALLIAVAEEPYNYPQSYEEFLLPGPERADKCRRELSCFSEEQVRNVARDLVANIAKPRQLANIMVDNVSAATGERPSELQRLGLPLGSWRKTLKDGLVDRLEKVRSRLDDLPDTTEGESSPQNPKCPDDKSQTHNGAAKAAAVEPHPISEGDSAAKVAQPSATPPTANPKCLCGCGEHTNGGRFISSHNGRLHKRLLKEMREGSKDALKMLKGLGWNQPSKTIGD